MVKKDEQLRKDVDILNAWKQKEDIKWKVWLAFGSGVSMTVTSIGAVIANRWEDIKHFFQALKP